MTLDKTKPFGVISGDHPCKFTQAGKYFLIDGTEYIDPKTKTKPQTKVEEPKVEEPKPKNISHLKNVELKALLEEHDQEWISRPEAIKWLSQHTSN